ncbi:SRPBCC family protein [Symbiobacterium thermophilum]|uniref:Carbon monoxide dehydrogenase subunit G n=2 Tax=Bacillota TaxID=1239 RepID=A0A7U3YG43_GEOS0|nr:carbon monoxide dehydrogenase subunit G [Symbiobacterium thermophilum]MBY6277315.1 carbon monoxide dehydrogenase [Symbiobacterium thermophilum]
MNGSGKVALNAGIEKAWEVLLNPQALKNCIMGCTKLETVGENKYEAVLSIGIAAVKGKYESTIEIADIQKPNHYKLIVKGEGGPGSVEATGVVDLIPIDENTTELQYTYDAEVGGKVAMVGQRMLNGVAKLIIQDFFKKFNKELAKSEQSV